MLGDTLTITHNAVSKVLSKINQDTYSAEYLLRSATDEFRAKVRHSTESAKPGILPFERHNIELTYTIFATATVAEIVRVSTTTIRCRRGDDPAAILYTPKALVGWLSDANVAKLIAWEA